MKTLILTGGAKGIGRALINGLSQEANLFVIDRDEIAGKHLEAKCQNPNLHFYYGDLANKSNLQEFVAFVRAKTDKIDGLIHNAAINKGGLVSQATYQDFMETLQVNVGAAYYLVQQFQSDFAEQASVILMSSTRNRQSMPDNESYSSSKGALLSLAHAMANSLRGKVRVNVICPGWIETSQSQHPIEAISLSAADHAQQLVGRVGQPEDILRMVEFLLDESKSGFITGQEFVVDGGMSKQMIYHEEHGWTYTPRN